MLSAVSVCRPRCLVPSQAAKLFLCNKLLHNSGSSKVNDCSFFPCLVCCLCRDDRTLLSTCGHPAGETSRVIVMPLPLPPPLTVPHRSGSSFVGQENATKLCLTQETGHSCSVEIYYDQFQCSSFKKELMHSFYFIFLCEISGI